jgi:hypothetical protein
VAGVPRPFQTTGRPNHFQKLLRQVCWKKWVVYSKRPFASPDAVLAYLSRYIHRVGITNCRLLALEAAAQTVIPGALLTILRITSWKSAKAPS